MQLEGGEIYSGLWFEEVRGSGGECEAVGCITSTVKKQSGVDARTELAFLVLPFELEEGKDEDGQQIHGQLMRCQANFKHYGETGKGQLQIRREPFLLSELQMNGAFWSGRKIEST